MMEPTKSKRNASGSTSSAKPEVLELEHVNLRRHDTAATGPTINTVDFIEYKSHDKFIWFVVFSVSIGGFLFGYDTGIISGALVLLGSDLGHELTNSEKQLVTSLTSGGAFVGALVAACVADIIGRKMVIGLGCIWFTVGSVVAASSYSVLLMSVARFIIGVGVGIVAMINPIYIAELSPSNRRGRMVTINSAFITGGQVIAYALGAAFTHVDQGWRYMFAIGAIPSLLLVALLPLLPETPRHLLYHDRHEEAFEVLRQIYPTRSVPEIQRTASRIEHGVRHSATLDQGIPRLKWALHQLYHNPAHFRSLFSACGLMAIQQLCGFNSLMYYSATLFALVGFANPVAVGLIVAGTNFLFTLVALRFIDRRRRRMLIATMWGLPVGLVLAAVAFTRIPVDRSTLQLNYAAPRWAEILVLFAIILYVAFYAVALGNVPWQANELLAMEVRALGTAMLTMTCWGCNILVSATFLSLMRAITPSGAFGLYAAVCFLGWIFVIFFYPEVAGLSLEGIREVFDKGFGIRHAEELQLKRRKREDVRLADAYVARMGLKRRVRGEGEVQGENGVEGEIAAVRDRSVDFPGA